MVVPLAPADIGEAIDVLADAFADGPMFRYLFPDDAERRDRVHWLHTRTTALRIQRGLPAFTTKTIARGLSLWAPPGVRGGLPLWLQVRHGLLRAPFVFGRTTFRRLLECGEHENEAVRRQRHRGPFWQLELIAVAPRFQRRGIGAALLEPGLARADADGLPCLLVTNDPVNLAFYGLAGFEVVERTSFGNGLVSHVMVRPPSSRGIERG